MRKDAVKPTNARKKYEAMPADFQDRLAEYEGNPFCPFFRRVYLISLPANIAGLTRYPGFAGRLSPCARPALAHYSAAVELRFAEPADNQKSAPLRGTKGQKGQKSIPHSFRIPEPAITAFRFLCTLHTSAVCFDK